MRLGIIGVGHLAGSLLAGVRRAGWAPDEVLLAPRGHGPELAERFGHALARDNAEVVAACDTVLLAVRPAHAVEALTGLGWRSGQVLISACAGVPSGALAGAAAPARVVRIMPMTAAEFGASPTVVWPDEPAARPFLRAIGTAIPLASETDFETATVSAAVYGWAQELIARAVEWSAAQGLPEATARQLVAQTFGGAARMQAESAAPMRQLLAELVTPGGITEAGLEHLRDAGALEAWDGACAVVLERLRGAR